jgi:AcrR family transcriptional regulator
LVLIAYRQLAANGFEGLRVRQVAAEAGVNNATLHHYFPTKEALVHGVVDLLLAEFQVGRAPRLNRGDPPPLEELRYEFQDTRHRLRETPEMYAVLMELHARSLRDPAIARVLKALERRWSDHLVGILERGVRTGVFRADLDLAAAATMIMVLMKGIVYHMARGKPLSAEADRLLSRLAAETERWLTG